jgi:hypothetical protein
MYNLNQIMPSKPVLKITLLLCCIGIAGLVTSCIPPFPVFENKPPATPIPIQGQIKATDFSSNGDLIQGWYWLRDTEHKKTAQWIFRNVPQKKDITLNWSVLATSEMDGGPGVNAHFYLYFGIPNSTEGDGLILGGKEITLQNTHDPSGYLCQGKTTLFWSEFLRAPTTQDLLFMISREDRNGLLLPIDIHIAFNQDSLVMDNR